MGARRFGRYTVETSNEDKVLFPDAGLTKGALIDYYEGHGPFPLRIDGAQAPGDVQADVRTALGI